MRVNWAAPSIARSIAMKKRFTRLSLPLLVLILNAYSVAMPNLERSRERYLDSPSTGVTPRVSPGGRRAAGRTALVARAKAAQRGSINGQVVLPSGQQVSNRIRITLSGYRVSSVVTYTDNRGRFVFQNIGDGTYTLEVEGDQNIYEPVTQEVRVTYGGHPVLVITLRERRNSTVRSNSNVVSAGELDQQIPDEARKEFEKGAQLSEKGKFQDAAERFKRAIAIFPGYLMARNNLGVQYLKLGKWSEAAEQFEAAIEIEPKAMNPRQNIAIALIEQKKYEKAIEHLNHALQIDSSSPATHLYAGIASLGVDEIDQAERELTLALSIGGQEYANAHFYLALVHMKKGARESAKRELNAYLEKLPKGEKAERARQLLEKVK
jgi:tetratricopeptide (TPR) repeat protein